MDVVTRKRRQRLQKKRPGFIRMGFRLTLLAGIFAMGGALLVVLYSLGAGAPPLQVDQTTVFYGEDGSIIGESQGGQQRYWVNVEEISPDLIDATLAIEDRRFYSHKGFDFTRIGAAVAANIKSGSKAQGASTITQQYARNLFLSHDKTWSRKIEEALYALRLEMHYDKEDILEGYVNTIYYGHGAYGIEAASRLYFNKSAVNLTLGEAAMLAAIPKGPTYYSPFLEPERAESRQRTVLAAMEETGMITGTQREEAEQEALPLVDSATVTDGRTGPFFQDYVRQLLVDEYELDPQLVEEGGLQIYTTLDPVLQEKAENQLAIELPADTEIQGSLVSIDPRSGAVKAMVGGKNYEQSAFNRATQAMRPPGSTFKPFLYYAALENGFTPTTSFVSEESTFPFNDGEDEYSPGNFGNRYADDFITMAEALAVSDNIFAVKSHLFLGPEALMETAKKAGIDSPLSPIPSLALGTENVNLLELTGSYSPFANGGYRIDPYLIEKVTDGEGNVILETETEKVEVFDPSLAYIMTDLMTGMFDPDMDTYTTVTGRSVAHMINRPIAGKSGSTPADSWMVGFSPQLLTGVWVGYDDNRSLHHGDEGQFAKRIWARTMNEGLAEELKLSFSRPPDVIEADIDLETGLLGAEACGPSRKVAFLEGTEPIKSCTEELEEDDNDKPEGQLEDELPEQKEKFFDRFINWFGE
ncbi:transglycosylase domain-containing protein [Thalassorhabdus alkalitolerans]|uniref:Transglycosylase domain-containing protein n=1 Tax=Thalassorhabdus alkalitolerans TaxID=2282697 RepID=A0ABW0YGM5_9BACI